MSTQMKLIVPLIDPNITKEDLSEKAGFVDAYLYDINRPSLVDNVFLMYETGVNTKEARLREERLKGSKFIRSIKCVNIKDKCYKIYAYNIMSNDVRLLKKALPVSTIKNNYRIISFWEGKDNMVNKAILWPCEPYSVQNKQVPEADYYPSRTDWNAIMKDMKNPEVSN